MRTRALSAAAAVTAIGFLVAGCGNNGDNGNEAVGPPTTGTAAASPTGDASSPGTATSPPGTGTTSSATTSPAATSTAIEVSDVTDQATDAGQVTFTSPTGNILCSLHYWVQDNPFAECWLEEANWAVPEPTDCDHDWLPHALLVGEEASAGTCASDYPHAQQREPLEYGRGLRVDDVVCESRETGVTCFNTETGHGFHASRDSYRVF